jgi:hypothetical protein
MSNGGKVVTFPFPTNRTKCGDYEGEGGDDDDDIGMKI